MVDGDEVEHESGSGGCGTGLDASFEDSPEQVVVLARAGSVIAADARDAVDGDGQAALGGDERVAFGDPLRLLVAGDEGLGGAGRVVGAVAARGPGAVGEDPE
jgi:hypothetical protein